jgi:glycerol-3-phosphate cytidylyltransferase-like family protein
MRALYFIPNFSFFTDLITENKGPPVYNEDERYKIARSIKWVDEVYEGAPYMNPISLLDSLDADFLVHGGEYFSTSFTWEICSCCM